MYHQGDAAGRRRAAVVVVFGRVRCAGELAEHFRAVIRSGTGFPRMDLVIMPLSESNGFSHSSHHPPAKHKA